MAYDQWAHIIIKSETIDLVIKNVKLEYGKFYNYNNKDSEIRVSNIEGKLIEKNKEFWLCTCGRLASPSGTEGSFDIYTVDEKIKIGHYEWECPWGNKMNSSIWTNLAGSTFTGEASGGNSKSGPLGDIHISIDCGKQKDPNKPEIPA